MSHRDLAASAATALAVLSIGIAATSPPGARQTRALAPEARWAQATDAWEAGHYPAALADLLALLGSPSAAEYLERIALLTGELFVTTDVTPDGRNPRLSPDGRYVTFETGVATAAVTRLVRTASPAATIADLPTTQAAFDPSGRELAWLRGAGPEAEIVVRDLESGRERVALGAGLAKTALAWAGTAGIVFIGAEPGDMARTDVYQVTSAGAVKVTDQPGIKSGLMASLMGTTVVYAHGAQSPFAPRGGGAGARGGGPAPGRGPAALPGFGIVDLGTRTTRVVNGLQPALSADGTAVAWLVRADDQSSLVVLTVASGRETTVRSGRDRLNLPALSPDGRQVAYQLMTHTDWEIYVSDLSGAHRRLTRDIQHDHTPRFLTSTALLGLMGEPRHTRSQLYDLATGSRTRLFSNNTIRTISPEYVWAASADGRMLAVQADRDGDTISVERSLSLVDLGRKVTAADLVARLEAQLAHETSLRARMQAAFKPVDALARSVVGRAAVNRVYDHERALAAFDSKHITMPGNQKAIEYLERAYRSFGYEPDVQWFSPPQLQGGRTANVAATLKGTVNPELVYVVSSHFDSVSAGPGADDNTSGTAALLEAARMLAASPLPATVVFVSFTGEEAGLLGSREFVRRAAEGKWRVVGALNNDMIGWAGESSRMDNTIRYSNPGIRDIQHGAAIQYSNLILYDAKYYRGTDAAAFYDAWGDIVGGLGSYPVLANPNYHQPTDFLETMNMRQILETAKVTAATIVYLASSPSRLRDVKAASAAGATEVTWTPSPESTVTQYVVAYGPERDPLRTRVTVATPRAVLPALPAGTHIAVKAINRAGLEGWDWARIVKP